MQAETASRASRGELKDEMMPLQVGLALEQWSRDGALYSTPGNATQALLGVHSDGIDAEDSRIWYTCGHRISGIIVSTNFGFKTTT